MNECQWHEAYGYHKGDMVLENTCQELQILVDSHLSAQV